MLGYIYKTTNIITGDFYIGKRYTHSDTNLKEVYLGSGTKLKEQIQQYGRNNFTREIIAYCNSNKELFELEKYYIDKYNKHSNCLNSITGVGYGGIYTLGYCNQCGNYTTLYKDGVCMSCIKKNEELTYYCPECDRLTVHYKNGACKSCTSRNINVRKFCEICQKETTHMNNYCRSHKLKLKKTEDGKIQLFVKNGQGYGHPWTLLIDDVSFIKDMEVIDTGKSRAFNIPHNALKVKCNNTYTSLNTLLYNNDITDWLRIEYEINNYKNSIVVTTDHPLPLINGQVKEAKDLNIGDHLISVNNNGDSAVITEISVLNDKSRSYDISTDTEYFNLSNDILSHNCRAFLSPWFERGGMKPADENDVPVFVGRFNIGAVSLHLPMILAKARRENKDFYEVLDYYLQLIRKLHIRTYEYLGEMKASTNPLAFCEGGFYGGNLKYNDKIKPLLKTATASFGITALNELQQLYNKKSLVEDGQFAIEVMEYINKRVNEFKEEDGNLYALYGTPAESLSEKQVKQFREQFGIIENVSDRLYVSNSFHCHVTEDISPIQKQDLENRFWNLMNGGKIQYVKYPISYNTKAVETLVERAMDMGFYEGVNLSLSYCDDCGHQELNMDVCPKCGSRNLTKIDRMNGYLSYSRVKGDTRLNEGKMAEIHDRLSM